MIVQNNSAFIALSDIQHDLVQSISWRPIAPGSSNLVFRGAIAGSSYILRINASSDVAYGVCRAREAQVLALIKEQPWAPVIIENSDNHGWCLMQDHGAALDMEPAHDQAVIAMLDAMHQFSTTVSATDAQNIRFDYAALFKGYQSLLATGENNALALALCAQLATSIHCLPEVEAVLMHQDLHPKNVCQGTNLVMIDWEYAGWGSPWLDTAALIHAFAIPLKKLRQLTVYASLNDSQFERGVAQGLAVNNGITCLWYWLRWFLAPEKSLSQGIAEQQEYQQGIEKQAIEALTRLKIFD